MTMLDLHRPAPGMGLSDRERGIVLDALRRRRVDLELDRQRFDRAGLPRERDAARVAIDGIDRVRGWLGDTRRTELGGAPGGATTS